MKGFKRKTTFLAHFTSLVLFATMLLQGCMPSTGGRRSSKQAAPVQESPDGNGSDGGKGANSGVLTLGDELLADGSVELRHIVNPLDGSFKGKVTIPKNFTGLLFLSGLNITSLSNRHVTVRFSFGRELEPIDVQATIGRAAGLTPQTTIEVLILDLTDRPFEDVRLLYDLYDYNDYRDGTGEETKEPVIDPRDGKLYCRGVKLEHDNTFEGQGTVINQLCDGLYERCLYTYAKTNDAGLSRLQDPLVPGSPLISEIPIEPALDLSGAGYNNDTKANHLKKCLPDNESVHNFNGVLDDNVVPAVFSFGSLMFTDDFIDYFWEGPFRAVAKSEWELKSAGVGNSAFFSPLITDVNNANYEKYPSGLFQQSINGTDDPNTGYGSFLFPRAGKLDLDSNIEYFGSANSFGTASVSVEDLGQLVNTNQSLLTAGETLFMNGCNIRVMNRDDFTNEGISSCNVTATIDLIVKDDDGNDISALFAPSIDVKLQLIRPSIVDNVGKEVLVSSLKTCSSSTTCGATECCYNDRCWDKSLVTQCLEDAQATGGKGVGEDCNSDYECSSLCCNGDTKACTVHLINDLDEVLCSKRVGQSCVARDWCRKENIPDCRIVKTGIAPDGTQECALRCYNVPTFGKCVEGVCRKPDEKPVPIFDPTSTNPAKCAGAIDPPTSIEALINLD